MKKSGNKLLLIIGIVLVFLLISGGVFAYVYFGTDMLKSEQELFAKYLVQDVQEIGEMLDLQKFKDAQNRINQNKYEQESTLIFNIEDMKVELAIDSQKDNETNKMYKDIVLSVQDEKILRAEYMQEDDVYSLRFTDIVKQFLSIENDKLKEFAKKFGLTEEELEKIPDKIEFDNSIIDKIKLSEEEKNIEINRYKDLIYNGISKDRYKKVKDVLITINEKTITTNSYVLELTPQDIKDLIIKFLEVLKEDEILLGKWEILKSEPSIAETLETYETMGINSSEEAEQFDYKNLIQKVIDKLKQEDETADKSEENESENTVKEENIVISVYEQDGKTVRIKAEKGYTSLIIDTLEIDEKKQIDIKALSIDEYQSQQSNTLTITKPSNENYNLNIENVMIVDEEQISTTTNVELIEKENNIVLNVEFDTGDSKVTLNRNTNIVNEIDYKVKLDKSNNIVINDLSKEKMETIFEAIGNKMEKNIESKIEKIVPKKSQNEADDLEPVQGSLVEGRVALGKVQEAKMKINAEVSLNKEISKQRMMEIAREYCPDAIIEEYISLQEDEIGIVIKHEGNILTDATIIYSKGENPEVKIIGGEILQNEQEILENDLVDAAVDIVNLTVGISSMIMIMSIAVVVL